MADKRAPQRAPVKLSSVVNAARYVPSTSNCSLIVAVRARPLLKTEIPKAGVRNILRVLDDRVVVVLDPDESKASGVARGAGLMALTCTSMRCCMRHVHDLGRH
jgi:hypothetical protein